MADTTAFVDAAAAEFGATAATSDQVRAAPTLGRTPLVVLSATEHGTPADEELLWQEWQRELAPLSANGVRRVVPGATHASLLLAEDDAHATATAILAAVEAARTGQPVR
jgi:hypothetical protein